MGLVIGIVYCKLRCHRYINVFTVDKADLFHSVDFTVLFNESTSRAWVKFELVLGQLATNPAIRISNRTTLQQDRFEHRL